MSQQSPIDFSILQKYDANGPRYTSYPTALAFDDNFFNDDLVKAVKTSPNNDLSLYIHVPFCHSLCYYCACNKVVTRHQDKAEPYLEALFEEMTTRRNLFAHHNVQQIHLGGGTPSFLTESQIARLMHYVTRQFNVSDDAEISIEIDPRRMSLDYIDHLASLGFNRLSIGVQDIDPKVQQAINRVQSTQFIRDVVTRAKQVGFRSVNLDLIYGLPHQSTEGFQNTLNEVIEMTPERISLFSYAHLPERFAAQRKLRDEWLPNSETKLALMKQAIESFCAAGYKMIGMDHFALPSDELAVASERGQLHRNFQGYTTHADCDLLGLGVSAISAIGDCFSQNHKELGDYYKSIDMSGHGVAKGCKRNFDDQLRGYVIRELMCNLTVDKQDIANRFDVDFDDYFAQSLENLAGFVRDGLVHCNEHTIKISPSARLIVRNICMSFDAYIANQNQQRYSRVI